MPKNSKLADMIFTEMAEYLANYPIFEEYCGGNIDKGIEIIRKQSSVIEDTGRSFVISYTAEPEGGPKGVTGIQLRGHAYQLPIKEASEEEALEDFLRTGQHSGIRGDIGWYFIESKIQPPPERRTAA